MKRIILSLAAAALLVVGYVSGQSCSAIADDDKVDCGYMGINEKQCEDKGCCWKAADSSDIPWCYDKNAAPASQCAFNWQWTKGPGFTDDNYNTMYGFFMQNINIQGKGGVVAAPDTNTGPGGSYYFAWERDSALTMKSFMIVNDFDLSKVQNNMEAWVKWLLKIQAESDPNGIDIITEPKYNLPDGDVFTGGWCRPQNDGPGLDGTALMLYANLLIKNGKNDYVKQNLWTGDSKVNNGGLIKYHLDWIVNNYGSTTCDLWEEVRSNDFFWNRITMRRAMLMGADFATQMGDSNTANQYKATAQAIETALAAHWDGNYIFESTNRKLDSATIIGLNDGYNDDDFYAPTSAKIATTIKAYNKGFCKWYTINQKDNTDGIPGILYGRYQGDTYDGGNPWVLNTASLANLFYRAAAYAKQTPSKVSADDLTAWAGVLGETVAIADLPNALFQAGDAVMYRIYTHVKDLDFHLPEQLDRNTGAKLSAHDLTWSYANVLVGLHQRKATAALVGQSTVEDLFMQ